MADYKSMIKRLLFFSEPQKKENFILKENKNDKSKQKQNDEEQTPKSRKRKNQNLILNNANNNTGNTEQINEQSSQKEDEEKSEISKKLENNLEYMKKIYSIPINGDIIIREFDIIVKDRAISAFVLFFDGMADRKIINDNILKPLMLLSNLEIKSKDTDVASYIRKHLLPQNQLKVVRKYSQVIDEVNFGGCGLFVDGIDVAFAADVKGWEHRTISRPNTEIVIRGPQEGFNEVLRINTALVRKILKDEDVIVENLEIGRRGKMACSMLYIKDIVNDSVVEEVRKRLKGIKVDYIHDAGELEQLIEDNSLASCPQVLATERPDRVASMLSDGKVAIMLHGNPFALVVPATLPDLMHSSEDSYIRFPYANFLRIIRILGIILTLLLPGMYVAITNFHHEMIPTDLLLAIEASREKVPFPSVVEILIMELAFELIREAGIRIPGPIGPTLGIIGALILGQAAVAANIISPILIIIVAVTGLGSFAIPNFSLGYSFRILRFGFIILGAMAGFLGITTGLFIYGLFLVNLKSFGVPYLSPLAPRMANSAADTLMRGLIWKQERRPDFMNTKHERKQPHISRKWTVSEDGEENGDE